MSPTFAKNAKVGQPPQPQYNFDSKNRITSASGIIYDAAGNVINDGTHTYTYDAENRMITVDGSAQAYFYDAFGRQIQTIYGGNTYSRIFGLNGRAEVQFSGNTWMLSELYAGSVGGYLGNYSNGTTYFAHRDQVGNRRMYTAPSGSVVQTCAGLPFGDGESCTGTSTGSVTDFTGQDWDPSTNLTRFPMRNYSMQQGRWMHPDPAGLAAVDPSNPQTWNRYAYVGNSPLSNVDPLGLIMCDPAWEPCNGVVYVDGVGSVSFAFGSFAGLAGLGLVNPVWHEPTYSGPLDDQTLESDGYWSFDYINSNVQSMLVALSRGAANNGNKNCTLSQRAQMFGNGLLNLGIAGAKFTAAAGVEAGISGVGTVLALYGVYSGSGNLTTGLIQTVGAFMPNAGQWQQAASVSTAAGSIAGLTTLAVTGGNVSAATSASRWEGIFLFGFRGGATGNPPNPVGTVGTGVGAGKLVSGSKSGC